ncbi:MAG: hypothetical protein ACRC5R_03685 [Mycoplasmatales bacterium]
MFRKELSMKKLIIIVMFCVFIISGCSDKETSEDILSMSQEEINAKVNEMLLRDIENLKSRYDFNVEDLEYTITHNEDEEEPYVDLLYTVIPKTASKFISIGEEESFSIYSSAGFEKDYYFFDRYYLLYVYNEFLVDRELGNKIDEMFIDLENQGIEYYIQGPTLGDEFVKYVENPQGNKSLITRLKPGIEAEEDFEEVRSDFFKTNYIDVRKPSDMARYMQSMNLYPIIKIELNSDNHTTSNLENLNEWAKQFYNSDILQIQFTKMHNSQSGCSMKSIDSLESCSPIYGFDFNGNFMKDFSKDKIKRKIPVVNSNVPLDGFIEDPNGVVYKWNEVPK